YRNEGVPGRRRSSGAADEQEAREAVAEVRSEPVRRFSDSAIEVEENAERRREDLIDFQDPRTDNLLDATSSHPQALQTSLDDTAIPNFPGTSTTSLPLSGFSHDRPETPDFDTTVHVPEIFLFEYGVVVIWGMS
ncbi:sporulation protein rmd1, partial [Teratosphaeriaceae sp. CCFEE 6253]